MALAVDVEQQTVSVLLRNLAAGLGHVFVISVIDLTHIVVASRNRVVAPTVEIHMVALDQGDDHIGMLPGLLEEGFVDLVGQFAGIVVQVGGEVGIRAVGSVAQRQEGLHDRAAVRYGQDDRTVSLPVLDIFLNLDGLLFLVLFDFLGRQMARAVIRPVAGRKGKQGRQDQQQRGKDSVLFHFIPDFSHPIPKSHLPDGGTALRRISRWHGPSRGSGQDARSRPSSHTVPGRAPDRISKGRRRPVR